MGNGGQRLVLRMKNARPGRSRSTAWDCEQGNDIIRKIPKAIFI